LSSNPIAPIPVTNRHSRPPALPMMDEKATAMANAHLIALVMQLP